VQGNGTAQGDEERAQRRAKDEREERQKNRTRTFSEWPLDAVPLPPEGAEEKTEEPKPEQPEDKPPADPASRPKPRRKKR
jgi:hypothetical protein